VLPILVGPILALGYSLLADGLRMGPFRSQSLGKLLFRTQVLNTRTGKPASYRDSVLRNLPVGAAVFFSIIPGLGWILLFLVGGALLAMEVYLLRTQDGERLGDVMADTEVVMARPREKARRHEPSL
jgi:uncharacterized RDD family membrane protein YckC